MRGDWAGASSKYGARVVGWRLDFVQVALHASTLLISYVGEIDSVAELIGASYHSPKCEFGLSYPENNVHRDAYPQGWDQIDVTPADAEIAGSDAEWVRTPIATQLDGQ